MTESAPEAGRWRSSLELILLCFSTAVVVGLGSSAAAIRENRYAALGFLRNSLLTLRRETLTATAVGILLGFVVLFVQWIGTVRVLCLRRGADPTATQGVDPRSPGSPAAYFACAISAFLVLGLQARRHESVSAPVIFFVIGAAAVWCGLHWLSRRADERLSSYFLILLCCVAVAAVAVVFASHRSVFGILLRPETVIAFLAWSALLPVRPLFRPPLRVPAPSWLGLCRRLPGLAEA